MNHRFTRLAFAAAVLGGALPLPALAHDPGHGTHVHELRARLEGYQEVPAVSTAARASFRATVDHPSKLITWRLSYADLGGDVQQAHIHFAQRGVNGGITVFLCTNLGNGPAGTPLCPGPRSGMLTGSITPNDVSPAIPATQGAVTQGLGSGEFDEFVEALHNKTLYVNVHSTLWPGGEVRAQLGIEHHGH